MVIKNIIDYFQIRDIRTRSVLGTKEKYGDSIFVPVSGQVEDFIKNYNALINYDMGEAVELYDQDLKKVDHFALLYSFKKADYNAYMQKQEYRVLEAALSNLDTLELINQYNHLNEKKES
jgi:hypothetical protein